MIKKGETVTFKNQSSNSMWPASAMHPTHRVYSGTSLDEHCPDTTGTAFDACKGFLPGQSWSFIFNKTGTWKYHDHLNPSATGTVVVE
jgi:plastocyanin